ncbi:MAG: OmpH family outer membrane protein [Deltaproteobacteria bacterium]|jgi:Skp family chaperone for outer membrane proteins|nr:OmpH family outer membrane protein [Deltaproteobacteria bacterium]
MASKISLSVLFAPVLTLTLALALAFARTPLFAQGQGEVLFGVVNIGAAIDKSKEGAGANKKVRGRYDELDKKLTARSAAIEKKARDLEARAGTMSEEAVKKEEAAIRKDMEAFRAESDNAAKEMEDLAQKTFAPLYDKAVGLIPAIAREKGLAMVAEQLTEQSGVVYSAQNARLVDITGDLTAAMDRRR